MSMGQSETWRPEYHRQQREWYLWNGHDALCDEHGAIRFFITAQDAYNWLAERAHRGQSAT